MSIRLSKVIDNYNLKEWIPEIDADEVKVTIPEINRPALQLAGFFDHFEKDRLQLIGNVENAYLNSVSVEYSLPTG